MKNWTFIRATGHKVIFASPEVVEDIKKKLAHRGSEIDDERQVAEAFVDKPGIISTNREYWSTVVDGLKVTIPVMDFPDYIREMRDNLNNPAFNGDNDPTRNYRSIYGWMHVIALTQGQYEQLYQAMQADAENVKARADAENQRLARAIIQVNKDLNPKGLAIDSPRTKVKPIGGLWH